MTVRQCLEFLLRSMAASTSLEMKREFLEGLTWMMDDNGTSIYEMRESWIRELHPEFLDLALVRWLGPVGRTRDEATDLLDPVRTARPDLQGVIEERLAEHA